jgi:hypothetical protein
MDPRTGLIARKNKFIFLPGIEPRFFAYLARSVVTVLIELSRFKVLVMPIPFVCIYCWGQECVEPCHRQPPVYTRTVLTAVYICFIFSRLCEVTVRNPAAYRPASATCWFDLHHWPYPSPLCWFPMWPTLPLSLFLYSWLFPTVGSVCSHLLTPVPRSRIFLLWRWKRYVHPKRRLTQDPHSATSQKTTFFIDLSSFQLSNAILNSFM